MKRCEIAAGFLQDETPSPYISEGARAALVDASTRSFVRCMKE
ncbi:hypothetical protein [Sphingomonas sp. M1-B02]|nr:hypothetical protein [Sphingomonas sp. S6-11]UZK65539.1 hypothetical protein OKW87_13625 [Sphingomonas sp. S6-11]